MTITDQDREKAQSLLDKWQARWENAERKGHGVNWGTVRLHDIAAAIAEAREEAEAPLRDKLGHVRVQRNEHQAYIVELETELREMRRRNEHWREEVGKKESRIGTLQDRLAGQVEENGRLQTVALEPMPEPEAG